jgi:hypothetical protein
MLYCSNALNFCISKNSGADRIRTDDPLLAKQVLSQLSYSPENFALQNFRPERLSREGQRFLY